MDAKFIVNTIIRHLPFQNNPNFACGWRKCGLIWRVAISKIKVSKPVMENEWVILFFSPADLCHGQKAPTFKLWWIENTSEWIPHPFLPHLICLMRTWLDDFMGSAFLPLRDDCSACPRCELPWTCGRAFRLTPAWSCIKRRTYRESSGERYFPTIMSFSVKLILGWFLHLVPVMTHCLTPALNYQLLDDSKQKYWSEEIQIGASWGPFSLSKAQSSS